MESDTFLCHSLNSYYSYYSDRKDSDGLAHARTHMAQYKKSTKQRDRTS
jgi:hypothetical protein